jgi:hypothetical protein
MELTPTATDDRSWDDLLQRFANALIAERDGMWTAADVAAYILQRCPTRQAKREALGALATVAHCTRGYIHVLVRLSRGFGTESRKPDVSLALYRACLGAAKRTGRTPADILEEALLSDWHAARVNQLGTVPRAELVGEGTCDGCGASVRVRMAGEQARALQGLSLPCPVCVRSSWDDGREARDVLTVAVLG